MSQLVSVSNIIITLLTLNVGRKLAKAAQFQTDWQTPLIGDLNHYGPDMSSPADRVKASGGKFSIVAENLASMDSVKVAMQRLMDSPLHKANILNAEVDMVGFAGLDEASTITQVFGKAGEGEVCSDGDDTEGTKIGESKSGNNATESKVDGGVSSWVNRRSEIIQGSYKSITVQGERQVFSGGIVQLD